MFVDHVKIFVKSGNGGDGACSFRKEAHVSKGGPDGGDGGMGGNLIFEVDPSLNTLMYYRFKKHFEAKAGQNGRNKNLHGKNGEDLILKVPPGTIIKKNNEIINDFNTNSAEQFLLQRGGRGGRGNKRFISNGNKAPKISEKGEPTFEQEIELELKIISDIGLIGKPNAGKSSFLASSSSAKPKIANYQFTTLTPKLGMVYIDQNKSFVMADIPGLIKGASQGHGLGIQFLKHIERTRAFLHIVDVKPDDNKKPIDNYLEIRKELESFDKEILNKKEIIFLNKIDKINKDELDKIIQEFKDHKITNIFYGSVLKKENIKEINYELFKTIEKSNKFQKKEKLKDFRLYKLEKDDEIKIIKISENKYKIDSEKVNKILLMTKIDNFENLKIFWQKLKKMDIEKKLIEKGAKNGDIIQILNIEFEFLV